MCSVQCAVWTLTYFYVFVVPFVKKEIRQKKQKKNAKTNFRLPIFFHWNMNENIGCQDKANETNET